MTVSDNEFSILMATAAGEDASTSRHLLPTAEGLTAQQALRLLVEGAGYRVPAGVGIKVRGSPDELLLRTESGKLWDARLHHGGPVRSTLRIGTRPTWLAYWI